MHSIGLLAILAQVPAEPTELAAPSQNVISLLLHANIVVQLTLLLLIGFSVVSWAIIGSKQRQLKRIKERCAQFYDLFWQSPTLDDIVKQKRFRTSPAVNVLKAGLDAIRDRHGQSKLAADRAVRRAYENEVEQMEYGVPFLATTGSAAPFIGLFGTVWGILNAFWKIGKTGASSLAIVGPHIAEALIATAIGLAAAIPAVIFYNIYVNKIRLISKDLQDFSDDVATRIEREYFQQ
ncbi:MAG: MotA/TolQ/ExbB proton channel family protein [Deltaproteobacteria bacterium]|nr:MotA/TolQ/ExbB proton channel family protein [Deltaproteobacteria bacterium]